MRYSLMLQFVVASTLVLVGFAAFFAWLQNRSVGEESRTSERLDRQVELS